MKKLSLMILFVLQSTFAFAGSGGSAVEVCDSTARAQDFAICDSQCKNSVDPMSEEFPRCVTRCMSQRNNCGPNWDMNAGGSNSPSFFNNANDPSAGTSLGTGF